MRYSTARTPATLTNCRNFAISARVYACISSGVLARASWPCAARRAIISGCASARAISLLSLVINARGVCAGIDDDLLTPRLGEALPQRARHQFRRAARSRGVDDAYGFDRVILRVGHAAHCAECAVQRNYGKVHATHTFYPRLRLRSHRSNIFAHECSDCTGLYDCRSEKQ